MEMSQSAKEEIAKKINEDIFNFLKKSVENYELGEYFRYCAQLDYINAQILYKTSKKESLPICLFLIQQSVEKYVKSYALIIGAINKNKLKVKNGKGIGHISGKAFSYSLKQKELNNIMTNVKKIAPDFIEMKTDKDLDFLDMTKTGNSLEKILNNKSLRRFSVLKILDTFTKIRVKVARYTFSRGFNKNFFSSIKSSFQKILSYFYNNDQIEIEKKLLVTRTDLIGFLLPLAVLTDFYEQETRYPNLNKKTKGPKDYMNKNKHIIKAIPRILDGLEKVGKDFLELYSPIKKLSEMPKDKRDLQYSKYFSQINTAVTDNQVQKS